MIHKAIDRRKFLQLAGSATMLSLLPRSLYGFAKDTLLENASDGKISINFLENTDVLVCGSTLFACDLALQTAKAGKRTMLVMDRVNPFFEGITCLRSWVEESVAGELPEILKSIVTNDVISDKRDGKIYFNALKASVLIEDALAEAGVRFLYNSAVAGVLGNNGRVAGVIFGGKTGLYAIEAGAVVDATVEATVARCAGHEFVPTSGPRTVRYVADFVKPVAARAAAYTARNGMQVKVDIHHYYADFEMTFRSESSGPLAFAEDYRGVYEASLECPLVSGEKRLRGADGYLHSGMNRFTGKAVPGLENLLIFGPYAIPGNTKGSLALSDPRALYKAFPSAAEKVISAVRSVPTQRPVYDFWNKAIAADSKAGLAFGFRDPGFDEPQTSVGQVRFVAPIPALRSTAAVVGGGTSGNAAAYTSSSLGTQTVCLERGLEMGGTNTLGGVSNLWYGNKTPAFEKYYATMGATNKGLNAPGFFKGVKAAGCHILFQSVVTGVAASGRNVSRVYLATPLGLSAIEASYFMDATGDGSVAAWAGNGYHFGGDHDEMTLVASFAGFRPDGGDACFTYVLPCDERSAFDTTRFIVSMRRNSKLPLDRKHFPPPFFIAPRESRHIHGGKTLTYLDALSGRRFSDAILRIESIPDMKGLATSNAAVSGFIATDWKLLLQATVPYSALIPTALDNVIVVGKAYSVAHDALCIARMQRDMAAMGMVAAESVKLAIARSALLRNIPVQELQKTLVAKQIMPANTMAADDYGFECTAQQAAERVASAKSIDAALTPSAILALLPKQAAIAALETYSNSDNPAIRRIQAFLGAKSGVESYLGDVSKSLAEPTLTTELFGGIGGTGMMPDQGFAPRPAVMLGCLSAIKEPRAVSLLVELGNRYDAKESQLRSAWGYFYSLSFGFEQLACEAGRAPLKRLLNLPVLKNKLVHRKEDPRHFKNLVNERFSYLRMALSRALLRCGDPQGALELLPFLDEAHIWIARAARSALSTATGQDFAFNAPAWKDWLAKNASQIKINPQV